MLRKSVALIYSFILFVPFLPFFFCLLTCFLGCLLGRSRDASWEVLDWTVVNSTGGMIWIGLDLIAALVSVWICMLQFYKEGELVGFGKRQVRWGSEGEKRRGEGGGKGVGEKGGESV